MALENRLSFAVVSALLAIIAATTAAILVLCHGQLIYSLDDPYISLALSDQIAHGHYGINASEPASPSSSILYPFLLAVFAWAPWQDWAPLVINTIAACATGVLFAREVCCLDIVSRLEQVPAAALLIVALCLTINVVGLVFAGLEHSLHLLTSVFVVFGLAKALDSGSAPPSLVAAIVLLPLWRFEGMALTGLAIGALALARLWRPALTAAATIAAALALYMTAMAHLGLPLLPSSIMLNSAAARELAEGIHGFPMLPRIAWGNFRYALYDRQAQSVVPLLVIVAARPIFRRGRRESLMAAVICGALLAQLLFSRPGWFARYQAYAVATGAAGAIVLWREAIAALLARRKAVTVVITVPVMLFAGRSSVIAEAKVPLASLGIYEQQYQMHRFAVDFYKRPVGVNDLGWVSYRNPNYVLDLWGLGSEEARKMRAHEADDPGWLTRLVAEHGIGLVMIYDQRFAQWMHPSWQRIAALKETHHVTAAFDTVGLYATSADAAPAALAALHDFARHIGAGTQITIFDPPESLAGEPR